MARATVSVVIPCYNYGRFLQAAVESALDQEGVDVEIIIVDDRSTDDSRDTALRLEAEHPEVRLLVNEQNAGHVRSFNAGWEASTGEYVVKLDADDLLTPDSLSRAVALFEAEPSVGLVYGHARHFETTTPPVGRIAKVSWTVWSGQDWLSERCRLGSPAITNPEMVLRSSLLRDSGAMNPAVPYAPDMEISLRAAALSDVGYIGGADQALHREHQSSMSVTDGSGLVVDLEARSAAFERAIGFVSDSAEAVALEDASRRALAEDGLRSASAARDRGRSGAEVTSILEFVESTYPASVGWKSYRQVAEGGTSGLLAPFRIIGRKMIRRARQELYYARWMVSGV